MGTARSFYFFDGGLGYPFLVDFKFFLCYKLFSAEVKKYAFNVCSGGKYRRPKRLKIDKKRKFLPLTYGLENSCIGGA